MAATNVRILNPADKTRLYTVAIGTGAIAATDDLVTDTNKWPAGSTYTNTASRITYTRVAVAGVIGDWSASAAGTLLT